MPGRQSGHSALESCNQSSAEEVAQGLLRRSACASMSVCVWYVVCVCVWARISFNEMQHPAPQSEASQKGWLYLKAWPGRETQTTVCSNISSAAADYYEFYYCLGSDVFQEETLIKRFTLFVRRWWKKYRLPPSRATNLNNWVSGLYVGCGPVWLYSYKGIYIWIQWPVLLLLLLL